MSGSNARGYSFRISAEGMQEFAADMRRLAGESDGAHQAVSKLIQASPELANSLLRAEEATKRAADRAQELREAQDRAARAAASLPASNARIADSLDRLERRTQAAGRGVSDLRGAMELLGASGVSRALGPVASQIGNVADLLSTASLAAGRFDGAVTALAPRLAAIAGVAALPVFLQSVGLGISRAGEASDDAGAAMQRWRGVLEQLNPTLEGTAQRARDAAEQIRIANLRTAEIEFGRAVAGRNDVIHRASTLDRQIADAESRLGTISGRLAENRNSPPLLGAREEGRQLQSQLEAAERRLLELREQRAGVAREFEAMQGIGRELDQLLSRFSAPIYDAPIGPQPPAVAPAGRLPRVAAAPRLPDQDAHVRAWQQHQAQAEQAQQAEQRRREEATRRFEQQSLEAFARIGENALDRIGGSLVDSFVRGERAALNFGNLMRGVIASAATDLLRLSVVNPFVNSAFGLARPTLGGAASAMGGGGGGLGGLMSMGSGLSGMGSSLGLGGLGAGVSGFLSTPVAGLFGGGGGAASGAATYVMTESGMVLASNAMPAGMTIGGAAMAVGGGFMLGSTVGGMIAGRHQHRRTNANIGAGVGSVAGLALTPIMGPFGPIVGGAVGGAIGGLIGPRTGPGFFHQDVAVGADGMLTMGDAAERRAGAELAALRAQTQQEIAQLNATMRSLGLRAEGGTSILGSGDQHGRSLSDIADRFTLRANDARVQGAIDRAGGNLTSLDTAQQAAAFAAQLDEIRRAAEDAADPIGAVRRQFDGMRDMAQRLGFGLDEATAAQDRAVRAAEDQRRAAEDQRRAAAAGTAAGSISGLADFARGLRTANDNAANPMARLAAAQQEFERVFAAAQGGDARALGRFQGAAETFRGLSRDVFGTGAGFADAEGRIIAALDRIGGLGADALTASVLAEETRTQTDVLQAAIGRLQGEVAGLRADVRQAQSNPGLRVG